MPSRRIKCWIERRREVRFNAEWLSELSFADLIKLASNFTIQQFLTRENFRTALGER